MWGILKLVWLKDLHCIRLSLCHCTVYIQKTCEKGPLKNRQTLKTNGSLMKVESITVLLLACIKQ